MSKTEHHYNKQKIVRVSISLTKESDSFYWDPGRKFLGITLRKPGVRGYLWHKLHDMDELTSHVLAGDIVFRKPFVTAFFHDKHTLTKWFESDGEARKWAYDNFLHGGPWITEYS